MASIECINYSVPFFTFRLCVVRVAVRPFFFKLPRSDVFRDARAGGGFATMRVQALWKNFEIKDSRRKYFTAGTY